MPSLPGVLLIVLGLFLINVGVHGAGLLEVKEQTAFLPKELQPEQGSSDRNIQQ